MKKIIKNQFTNLLKYSQPKAYKITKRIGDWNIGAIVNVEMFTNSDGTIDTKIYNYKTLNYTFDDNKDFEKYMVII